MRHPITSTEFNTDVSKAIDKGLEILGDASVKQAFYHHVGKKAKITREEIPTKLDAFCKALTDLFYEGALILERRIAQDLFDILDLDFVEKSNWNLSDYVNQARNDITGRS